MGFFDIFRISAIKSENGDLKKKLNELGAEDIFAAKKILTDTQKKAAMLMSDAQASSKKIISDAENKAQNITSNISNEQAFLDRLIEDTSKYTKQVDSLRKKISRSKELYKQVAYTIDKFFKEDSPESSLRLNSSELSELEELSPSIFLKLHCMDIRELRKEYKQNDKQIDKVLEKYADRYTTKANKAIYKLMVIALRAELQNVLYSLKYEKLDVAIANTQSITQKYLNIAGEGNQNIVTTLTKFIGEIECLFINAVKIEYNYYVKKEQAKQEQLAIREQMRQEAEERRALEEEKKKIEREEAKYNTEIEKLTLQLQTAPASESDVLNAKILELQNQISQIAIKKSEITSLQNGKAGNVYIISNLGSFGENVFKIGMTRRLEPQDRVDELGSASVPFRFDVHSFIFSDNAVGLENKLHATLSEKRVNKVNLRKEFFNATLDELEELVTSIEPTAEFNRTMLAEEYRQSLSSDANYIVDESIISEDEE